MSRRGSEKRLRNSKKRCHTEDILNHSKTCSEARGTLVAPMTPQYDICHVSSVMSVCLMMRSGH